MERYAAFFERHRWAVALFVAVVTATFFGLARTLQIDDVALNIFRSDNEEFRRLEQLFEDFGADDRDVYLVLETDDWFTPSGAALLRDASAEIGALDAVEELISLEGLFVVEMRGPIPLPRKIFPGPDAGDAAFERAREDAHAHPLGADQTVTRDGRTAVIIATLDEELQATSDIKPVVEAIQAVADRHAGASEGAAVRVRLTGVPAIRVQILEVVFTEDTRLFLLALGLGLVVSFVVFRNLGALLAAGLASSFAAVWGVGSIALTDGEMDLMKTALPSVVLIIVLTDAVHLVMDMRFQRAAGLDRVRAAGAAIRHLGPACLLTSFTTAVGFGSLALGSVEMIRSFGVATAVAVGMGFLTVLTVTPLVAALTRDLGRPSGGRGTFGRRLADRIYGPVERHAGAFSVLAIVGTLALGAVAFQLEPDNRLTEVSPHDDDAFQALVHLDEVFGGSMFAGIVLEWEEGLEVDSPAVLSALAEATEAAREAPRFSGVVSLLDVLRILPGDLEGQLALRERLPEEVFAKFARPDLRRALIRARLPDLPSSEAEAASEDLERRLREVAGRYDGVDLHLTGTTIVARRNIDVMILDFVRGFGLAALVIFLVISIVLRSPRLGLISLVPNAFPIAMVAALLYLSGHTLQIHNAVSFTILLGIAVDDTIHLLLRFRRELEVDGDVRAAVRRAVFRVGAAMFTTTAILIAGFAGMLTSEVPPNQVMGTVCLLGFAAALVGDLVLLPALLIRFVPSRGRPGSA